MSFGNPFKAITAGNIFIIIGASLIIFQVFAKLSTLFFGTSDIRLGWAFTLILGFLAVMIPWIAIVKREGRLEKSDVVGIILIVAMILVILIYGKSFVPEIFSALPTSTEPITSNGLDTIQSTLGR